MNTPESPELDNGGISPLYSEVPPRERDLLPGVWRFVVLIIVAASFGLVNGVGDDSPTWILYFPKFFVALFAGVGLGVLQDKPKAVKGA